MGIALKECTCAWGRITTFFMLLSKPHSSKIISKDKDKKRPKVPYPTACLFRAKAESRSNEGYTSLTPFPIHLK